MMERIRRGAWTGRRARTLALSLLLALTGVFAVGSAGPASAADGIGCYQRGCIYDIAYAEMNNGAHNRESGPNNCNYFSGYWGNSGDDICGTINGSRWRSNNWCADFARAVWWRAGANTSGLDPWAGSFYRANKSNGSYHSKGSGYSPQLGDAVIFDWDGTSPSLGNDGWDIDHVGIVVRSSGSALSSIDGNTTGGASRDGIFWKDRNTSRVVGYISPRF